MSTIITGGRCNFYVGINLNYGFYITQIQCFGPEILPFLTFKGQNWCDIIYIFSQLTKAVCFHGYLWDSQPMMKYSERCYVLGLAGYVCEFLFLNNGREEETLGSIHLTHIKMVLSESDPLCLCFADLWNEPKCMCMPLLFEEIILIICPLNSFHTSAFQACASESVMGTFYQVMMIGVKTRDNDIGGYYWYKTFCCYCSNVSSSRVLLDELITDNCILRLYIK